MIVFGVVVALFLAGTLLLIVPPLWQGAARRSALGVALFVPLAALGGYALLGDPDAITMGQRLPPPAPGAAVTAERIQQMVAALALRMKDEPGNFEGWARLGRSYATLGRFRDAALALRRASELRPADATLLADLADLVAMNQGRRLAGEPATLVQQALDADPRHPKALALAGSVAFEARDYPAARAHWERLLATLPPDAESARALRGSIAQTRVLEAAALGDNARGAVAR